MPQGTPATLLQKALSILKAFYIYKSILQRLKLTAMEDSRIKTPLEG